MNPCVRCGKERIDGKIWTEMVGQILVTHTKTICPDGSCQKIIEEELAIRREKYEYLLNKKKEAITVTRLAKVK